MKKDDVLEIVNKTFKAIFNKDNIYSLEELKNKFAFDMRLPIEVKDSTTGETTYASVVNGTKFITNKNMEAIDVKGGWLKEKVNVKNLQELLDLWDSINYITTERVYDSMNVIESDPIYSCTNVYSSTDCGNSNNIVYSDGVHRSNYAIASSRSDTLNYTLRVSDSNTVTNSYEVICSSKISNSLFIQDCSNLYECIFCSHISNKEYAIANMEFSKNEYFYLKEKIIEWILSK
ncbi:MAG: hypothetical protein NC483_04505 [Ruminococcus sp.]|nr:hypothetical protein [Ruminococcus sp.]